MSTPANKTRVKILYWVGVGLAIAAFGLAVSVERGGDDAALFAQDGDQATSGGDSLPPSAPPDLLADVPPSEITAESIAAINDIYRETNQLPVGNSDGTKVVGYMSYRDFDLGEEDSVGYWEVYAYDTHALVGYRVEHAGFVPIESLPTDDPVSEIVENILPAARAESERIHDELMGQLDTPSDE